MGSVRGLRVSLQSASHVEGDVYHQALVMEQGAFFEGRSRRADNPMADPPRARSPHAEREAALKQLNASLYTVAKAQSDKSCPAIANAVPSWVVR